MNCKQCLELLVDYNRGELPADSRAAIASHLQTCKSCSAQCAKLLELATLLDLSEQPSAAMQEKFQARLAAELAKSAHIPVQKVQPYPGLFQKLWPSRPVAALCYSFALLACGIVSGQLLPPSTLLGSEYASSRGNTLQICSVPGPANNDVL